MKPLQILMFLLTTLQSYGQYQWTIIGEKQEYKNIKSGEKCHLFNVQSKKVLGYHKQKKGINLSWLKPQKTNFNIIFKDKNDDGVLDTQDSVAIYVVDGAYLKYGVREYSINMVWSQIPVYEWVIVAENADATTFVQPQKKYGLYNRSKQAYMICAESDGVGVRLQWSDEW